jgi:hypothetical protein
MKKIERLGWERRFIEQRAFAHFEPDTGMIVSVTFCQIPPVVEGLATAVFDNVEWSLAIPDYRVDLNSVREVEDDHPHCELIKVTMQ